MPHQSFFEFQTTKDLNKFLREYGQACLSNTIPPAPSGFVNVNWQTDSLGNLSANVPESTGGGGVNPGLQTQLPFYQTTSSVVSPSLITTDTLTKSNLNVPNILSSKQSIVSGLFSANGDPSGGVFPILTPSSVTGTITGGGWNFGSEGWTVSLNESLTSNIAQRGIGQNRSGTIQKHAIGDTAGIYSYTRTDGGVAATSDEGVTAATLQSLENVSYFFGTVASTSQVGGTPVLAFSAGNNWTTDGAFLLNISKGTISGNMNGNSVVVSMDTGSGSTPTYLNALPVTAVSLPISTAIGISQTALAPRIGPANVTVPVTFTVNLVKIGSVQHPFTLGSVVTVAGSSYPEQSIITAETNNGDGTQSLTMSLRNPNSQAIIFQGGIQGQYISFDANITLSGLRSSYYAFGSLTGNDLIYGINVAGIVDTTRYTLPQAGCEAAQPSGVNSGFHLYPGAEIVANTDFGFACVLEQNGVHWDHNDAVENPHYPVYGGSALFVVRQQFTPSNSGFGSALCNFTMDGPGTAGGNTFGIRLQNAYSTVSHYSGSGGPLAAPIGIGIIGAFSNNIYMSQAPDTGAVVFIQDHNAANADRTDLFDLNWSSGGRLSYTASTQLWDTPGSFIAGSLLSSSTVTAAGFGSFFFNNVQILGTNDRTEILFNGTDTDGLSQRIRANHNTLTRDFSLSYESVHTGSHAFKVSDVSNVQQLIETIDSAGVHIIGELDTTSTVSASGFQIGSTAGTSGTFTFGTHTVVISGGIITSVT